MSGKLHIETRVRSLASYLAEIEKGIVQIPTFQRDYVWDRDAVKALFDSIKKRYPIGSILFWRPEIQVGDNKQKIGSYFIPQLQESTYILDGFQRLSTLFGCLTNPKRTNLQRDINEWEANFSLFYDLEEEAFVYLRPQSNNQPYQVPVYIFMNSSDFRQYARRRFEMIHDEHKIEKYYDRADKLSRVLLEYQIASIDINQANIEEAVDIFSRVNSKGLDISLDWMANALSARDGFRFGTKIDELLEDLKPYNFDKIDRNALFRCVQSSFGKLYIDNSNIEVMARRPDFIDVTLNTIPKIKQAVNFLFEELLVLDSRLLPYNIQLIFIVDFFKRFPEPTRVQIDQLKEWFWITTYSNYFTLYSLANQRKAYQQFHKYLDGNAVSPVYNDQPNQPFQVSKLPEKITMGSVRAKALTLYLLNYSQNFEPIVTEEVLGYRSIKITGSSSESANIVPFVVFAQDEHFEPSLANFSKPRGLFDMVDKQLPLGPYFINEDMARQAVINGNVADLLINRHKLIEESEKIFVENLNMIYGPKSDYNN